MMRSGRWITDTKPGQPITKVARRALEVRLKTVLHYAPLAVKTWKKDIEYVHQLRVATRRARAALQIFGDLLPEKEVRWIKRKLRRLRQAAGDARDLDVLRSRLTKVVEQNKNGGLEIVISQIGAERKHAQRPLIANYKSAKRKRFNRRSRKLVKRIAWQREELEPQFGEAAKMSLSHLVNEFFQAATADLSTIETLHEMRICGKQLRYGMELLAGAFDKSFRNELYPVFGEVQEKLGTINDHATAITLLSAWIERMKVNGNRAALAELIACEELALDETSLAFRDWWNNDRAAELHRAFDDFVHPSTMRSDECSYDPNAIYQGRRPVEEKLTDDGYRDQQAESAQTPLMHSQ